jgi:hypothetical protein
MRVMTTTGPPVLLDDLRDGEEVLLIHGHGLRRGGIMSRGAGRVFHLSALP